MRYIRQATTVLLSGVVLFFTSCSDNRKHKIDTDNHFEYGSLSQQQIPDTKTHLISSSKEENKSKLIPIQKDTSINSQEEVIIVRDMSIQQKEESDAIISKLQDERDEAIKITLELKKANDELNSKIPMLNEKVAVSAAALMSANKLVEKDKSEIATISKEKEEAIALTLKMKDESQELSDKLKALEDEKKESLASYDELKAKNGELENKILALDTKIEELLKKEEEEKATYEKKLQESQSLVEKVKDEDASSLEALKEAKEKVIDELKSQQSKFQDIEDTYKREIEELKVSLEEANSQKIGIKTKLAASAAALLAAQQLTANKDENVTNIIQERDDAIKVALEMKKEAEKKDANLEELNQKMEQLNIELEKSKSQLSEKGTKFEDLNQSIGELSTELEESKKELSKKVTELEEVNKKVDELTQQLEEEKTASDEQNQTISTALEDKKEELDKKDIELQKLKNRIDELSKDKEDSKIKIASTIAALMQAEKLGSSKNDEINSLNEKLKEQKESCQQIKEKLDKKVVIGEILNTFKLSKVEFETDSDVLTEKSTQLLDKVSEIMKEHTEYKYRIQGHTDSQGKEEHNLKLSNERAKSVQNYLISKGVDARLLSHEGFGSKQPIADNSTEAGRLANRRVVFEIVN